MFSEAEYAVIWSVYSDLLTHLDAAQLRQQRFVDVDRQVRALAGKLLRQAAPRWNDAARDKAMQYLLDELFGLGPLETLLASPRVSEVQVEGVQEVRVVLDGRLTQTNVRFRDDAHLRTIQSRAASLSGVAAVTPTARGFAIRKLEQ